MSSILDNVNRNGNYSSSKIFNLTKEGKTKGTFGAPALTYIKEKQWERKLKRSISTEAETRPILWGRFLETWVHEMLPATYEHVNDITLDHPKYAFWKGSPDFKQAYNCDKLKRFIKVVSDLKCPQPKAFCQLVDNCLNAIIHDDINQFKDNHEDYYWQLVSNGIITDSEYMELIVYMPYEKDLQGIRDMAENFEGLDQYKYRFIAESSKHHLAYLPDDSDYKDLNIFRFKIPQEDKMRLEGLVVKAGALLEI